MNTLTENHIALLGLLRQPQTIEQIHAKLYSRLNSRSFGDDLSLLEAIDAYIGLGEIESDGLTVRLTSKGEIYLDSLLTGNHKLSLPRTFIS